MEERKDSEPTEEFSDHSTEEQVEEYEDLSEEEEVDDHGFGESQLEMDRSEEEQAEEEKNESEEVEEEDYYEVIEECIEQEGSEEGYSGEEYIEEVIEEESVEERSDHEEIEEMDSKKTRHVSKEQESMTSVSPSHCADNNYELYSGKSESIFCKKKRKLDLDVDYECKKYKQETSPKPNSDSGPTDAYHQDRIENSKKIVSNDVSKEHRSVGSSGKRKRSRWDLESENPEVLSCNDEVTTRKKTRWASDENQLKMLGPLHLPELTKSQDCAKHNPVIQELNEQLMKINEKLLRPEIADNQTEKRSPSPVPVYNDMGIRINTREMRLRAKLAKRKAKIISKLVCRNLQFALPQENAPLKFHKKLYVPAKEYPEVNFVGLIIGPRGNTLKRMEIQTGSRIFLRGKGSAKEGSEKKHKKTIPSHTDNDDLHVLIEADNQKSLDAAVEMVERLLVPLAEMRGLKMAQLRELAMLNGNIKSSSCDTCVDAGHLTSYCPLTAPAPAPAPAPGKKTEGCRSIDLFGELRGQVPLSTSSDLSTKETDSANLYVGYLPQSVDGAALRHLFCSFGTITSLKVVKDHATGRSKGYGFVTYDNPASAAKAVKHMNRFQIGDKRLAVRVAGPPPAATPHYTGSVRPNSVGFLPVYTGQSPIPQPMPGVVGLFGPPMFIMPGSCSYFPQNGNTFTHPSPSHPSPDPAVLPGPLVSMTPVSCTYLLQTTAGAFKHGDHLMWPPPVSYVP